MSALKTLQQRLEETPVVQDALTGCHNWQGRLGDTGYAMSGVHKAYRLAWEHLNGPIPRGAYVLHSCDNRACVNPAHLFLGTHAINMQDMKVKGRAFHQQGQDNGNAQLTTERVRQIKAILRSIKPGTKSSYIYKVVSNVFGVSYAMVYHIATGRNWSHVL